MTSSKKPDKQVAFHELVVRVKACTRCPRMAQSARVLGQGCGPLDASVMFIGEAPGRLGADESELPFHGDRAGKNFESLLGHVGLSRYSAFVTNAVLCNPKDANGRNATPTSIEVANCAPFLREQIELVRPQIVASLGATALASCDRISPHGLTLSGAVRTANQWMKRTLVPLYHPGQRAMVHRSYSNQLADYQFVAELATRAKESRRRSRRRSTSHRDSDVAAVAKRIVASRPRMSYFALHKLFFMAEVKYLESTGRRLTKAYVIRQKDGPYCVDLHVSHLREMVPNLTVGATGKSLFIGMPAQQPMFSKDTTTNLSVEAENAIDYVIERYGSMSDADLKRCAYLSTPMRQFLRKERALRINMFNAPVLPHPSN